MISEINDINKIIMRDKAERNLKNTTYTVQKYPHTNVNVKRKRNMTGIQKH